ncbi:succinylglutamate-semialdehyde dehydrogenase [Brevundimonas subvibrioides]|uniref:Succinylglutamic semialdehyde dehydrogenase n=1 Tax=Brevundimonas subvibrioides (strain ATCC 15264 / DSM 4735 / LMG 14903 / NBRC 16000 / CB 81) TaxID=633149 RepID=D9QFU1_BRESC|nr:succinylglutamate-semialdehyde dehydrogenase [Brevundimonas subvibrioides]ADL00655.1 succinylglutamic semialdehyde dehydrogenase [Brevundimonas subvibrioides ATCC 15264]
MTDGKLYIDGRWTDGEGDGFASFDPATEARVWRGNEASTGQIGAAVEAARAAFPDWADRPRADRIEAMKRYQAALKARAPAFAEAISRETGKALWETTAELGSMAGKVDLSIRAYDERTGERTAETAFGHATLRHRPHGVAAILGPFNFPGHLPNGHIVPALLAGDTVVFKPSEETPHTGQLMAEALQEADLPAGVFNLVQGGRDVGAALLDQPIDALMFTGSGAAGAHFRRKFADDPHVILALELGGNNPLVVWDAADAEAVASIVVQSAFVTTGQRCSCARRLIVPEGPAGDAVLEAVMALMDRLTIGPWNSTPEPYMGSLISERAADLVLGQAVERCNAGARVLKTFGRVDIHSRAFVHPGLIDVTGVDVPDEEIFGPILSVTRVPTFEAAIAAANATRYGLSAGLVSDNPANWDHFIRRIRAGVVNFNRPTTGAAGDMPFGGLGASGNHRPSAYYAADYCAYPVASFEAGAVRNIEGEIRGLK